MLSLLLCPLFSGLWGLGKGSDVSMPGLGCCLLPSLPRHLYGGVLVCVPPCMAGRGHKEEESWCIGLVPKARGAWLEHSKLQAELGEELELTAS